MVLNFSSVNQPQSENPWTKFAGVFQGDADFAEIADNLRAERNVEDED